MRILVTGATGFIGPHVVRRLAREQHEVISSSRAASGPPEAALHVPYDLAGARPFPDPGPLDAIVHLGGYSSVQDARVHPMPIVQVNVLGTLRALLLARQTGARFLLASSQRVYETGPEPRTEEAPKRPTNLYGYSKLAAELYTEMAGRLYGISGAIMRFFSVYGPGQVISGGASGVVSILAQRALEGAPLMVMSRQRKDFTEVSDVVEGMLLALAAPASPPRAYNIATGVGTGIGAVATLLRALTDSPSPIIEEYSEPDPGDLVADITRARQDLGYQPRVSLEEGLRTYVDWLRTARADSS